MTHNQSNSNFPFKHSYHRLDLDSGELIDAEIIHIFGSESLGQPTDTATFKSIIKYEIEHEYLVEEIEYQQSPWRIRQMDCAIFNDGTITSSHRARHGPELLFLEIDDFVNRDTVNFAFVEDGFLNSPTNKALQSRLMKQKLQSQTGGASPIPDTQFSLWDLPIIALYLFQRKMVRKNDYFTNTVF